MTYAPDKRLWSAIAAGFVPGLAILVSLASARSATGRTRALIVAIATFDVALLGLVVAAFFVGAPLGAAGLEAEPILGVALSGETDVEGSRIEEVAAGSAAAEVGLVAGETVLAVDDESVRGFRELQDAIARHAAGEEVTFRVRDAAGSTRDVPVVLGARWAESERSTAFHQTSLVVVLCGAFFLAFVLGVWGTIVGESRWEGIALLVLAAWGGLASMLLDGDAGLIATGIFTGGVFVFAIVLSWRARTRPSALDGLERVEKSRGFFLGLIATGAWAVRATLAVVSLTLVFDVTAAPVDVVTVMSGGGGSGPPNPVTMALTFVLLVIAAPVFEELLFRGALLPWLASFVSPWKAIALTSLVFGAMHIPSHGLSFLVATAYGAGLGWTRVRTGSLWPCIALHAAINFAASLRSFF